MFYSLIVMYCIPLKHLENVVSNLMLVIERLVLDRLSLLSQKSNFEPYNERLFLNEIHLGPYQNPKNKLYNISYIL